MNTPTPYFAEDLVGRNCRWGDGTRGEIVLVYLECNSQVAPVVWVIVMLPDGNTERTQLASLQLEAHVGMFDEKPEGPLSVKVPE